MNMTANEMGWGIALILLGVLGLLAILYGGPKLLAIWTWIKSLFGAKTKTTDNAAAIRNYQDLKKYPPIRDNPDAKAKLCALWPYLEPPDNGNGTPSEPKGGAK